MNSLRHRLMLWFMALSVIGWAISTIAIWYRVSHEIEEIYDAQLVQTSRQLAQTLPLLLKDERTDPGQTVVRADQLIRMLASPTEHDPYAATLSARAWWHGRALSARKTPQPAPPAMTDPGVSIETREGQRLRRYRYYDANSDLLVEVTEHHTARTRIIREFALTAVLPLLALLPLLGIAAWLTTRRGLRPLDAIVSAIGRRSSQDLEPLSLSRTPDEIRPLIEALNQLLERVRLGMEREQRFTADASHELRTPLAGLRVQAQLALRTPDDRQRRKALKQLIQGIDRSTHVVEQLLIMARLDPERGPPAFEPISLAPLLAETAEQLAPLAAERGISLVLRAEEVTARLDRDAVLILLRNLVDNAIRYSPGGGQVRLASRVQGQAAVIEVSDSGPGIPADQRARLLEPFQRGDQTEEAGCGLGLSIVQRIAAIHGGRLELRRSSLDGLAVEVFFPAATAS